MDSAQKMRVFTACQISAARVTLPIFARHDCQVCVQAIASKALHFAAQSGILSFMKIFLTALAFDARQVAKGLKFRERTRNRACVFA
jgi:hypothetical protein